MDKTMRAVVIPAINAEKSEPATDAVKLTAPITLKHTKIQSNLSIGAMSAMANTTIPDSPANLETGGGLASRWRDFRTCAGRNDNCIRLLIKSVMIQKCQRRCGWAGAIALTIAVAGFVYLLVRI